MIHLLCLLSLSACAPQDPEPAAALPDRPAADRVARHGITWQFDREYTVGTFCNGDPWVLGPVRIIAIDPVCTEVEGRMVHGATIDPDPSQMKHGYDSGLFGQWKAFYDERRNVALRVARGQPLLLRPLQSLVSVQSNLQPADKQPQIQLAAVLTCVGDEPPADSFRPPYCKGTDELKSVRHREADLDYLALATMTPVDGMPDVVAFAQQFDKLWLDHFPSWVGRFAHPVAAMKDYGRDLAADVGSAALLLNADFPNERKRELLVRFTQFGIDCYGCLQAGGRWSGNGGHASGRKFPILFAGQVLRSAAMLAIGRDYQSVRTERTGKGTSFFGEDCQTFFVAETAPGEFNWGHGGYTEEHRGIAEWGFSHTEDPAKDVALWDGNPYRRCCTACAWVGYCLAARAMGLVDAWHHDAFFAYLDRYMNNEHRPRWRAWTSWHGTMWDAERPKY